MIIPAVFAFFGESAAHSEGAPLMFITLPKIFAEMPLGNVIGAVFFIMVILAALTSNIALTEALVAMLTDKFKIKSTGTNHSILTIEFVAKHDGDIYLINAKLNIDRKKAIDYYKNNYLISSAYDFMLKVINLFCKILEI